MTKTSNNNQNNQNHQGNKQENAKLKPKFRVKSKFIAILALIIAIYAVFQYFMISFYPKSGDNLAKYSKNLQEITKNDQKIAKNLKKTAINHKNSDFIYQTLLKNQQEITKLQQELDKLKDQIHKNNHQKRIGRIILLYVKWRSDIFNGNFSQLSQENLRVLTNFDQKLQKNLINLQKIAKNLKNKAELQQSFAKIIPQLIISKNYNENDSFLGKIRHNIASLVIIRRIDNANEASIDAKVNNIEKSLNDENYEQALKIITNLHPKYHEITQDFTKNLKIITQAQKLDQEILTYLQNLT